MGPPNSKLASTWPVGVGRTLVAWPQATAMTPATAISASRWRGGARGMERSGEGERAVDRAGRDATGHLGSLLRLLRPAEQLPGEQAGAPGGEHGATDHAGGAE